MSEMTYDERTYDLAVVFVNDTTLPPEMAHKLAQEIQRTIEDFLEYETAPKVPL